MPRSATKRTATKQIEVEDDLDELEEDTDTEDTDDDGVEEVDDDDLLLDEEDDDEDVVEVVRQAAKTKSTKKAPAKGKAKAKRAPRSDVVFGVRDLCDWLTEHNENGKVYQPKDLRNLIRKMAREDDPRVIRNIIAGNKERYDWPDGLKDPEVKRIIKAVRGGEIESARKEALDALKERKAAKDAAAGKTKTKAKPSEKAMDVIDEDEDEDFEDDE